MPSATTIPPTQDIARATTPDPNDIMATAGFGPDTTVPLKVDTSSLPAPVKNTLLAPPGSPDAEVQSAHSWHENAPFLPFLDEVRAAGCRTDRKGSLNDEEAAQAAAAGAGANGNGGSGSLWRRRSGRSSTGGRRSLSRLLKGSTVGEGLEPTTTTSDSSIPGRTSATSESSDSLVDDNSLPRGCTFALDRDNEEFHRTFTDVKSEDRLVQDYACAWNKEGLLIQGRMWVSQHHVCFKGWTSSSLLCINMSEIHSVEKKNIALVIPNSMELDTDQGRFFFASFFNRDSAYDTLYRVWGMHRALVNLSGNNPCTCNGLGVCSVCYLRIKTSGRYDSSDRSLARSDRSRSSGESANSTDFANNNSVVARAAENVSPIVTVTDADALDYHNDHDTSHAIPTPPESPATHQKLKPSDPDRPPATCPCSPDLSKMRSMLDKSFSAPIHHVWATWLTTPDPQGGWFGRFIVEKRKLRDVAIGPWVPSDHVSTAQPLPLTVTPDFYPSFDQITPGMHRTLEYIMPLSGPIGPKQTKCIVSESILAKTDDTLCLQMKTLTPDVPSGQAFHVLTRICLNHSGRNATTIKVATAVVFTKSSWIKAAIEKATPEGQRRFYGELDSALEEEFSKHHTSSIQRHPKPSSKPRNRNAPLPSLPPRTLTTIPQPSPQTSLSTFLTPNTLSTYLLPIMILTLILSFTLQAVAMWKVAGVMSRVEDRLGVQQQQQQHFDMGRVVPAERRDERVL
ncbi:hypothetical protein DFS34DRAFT_467202 [Phlyctochytrium arcticum]|nr:hypothetical protein DFS34DRAFT_467202 [Phlyctochytrium arcticum]